MTHPHVKFVKDVLNILRLINKNLKVLRIHNYSIPKEDSYSAKLDIEVFLELLSKL